MRVLRCACGSSEYYDGGVPAQPCQGCSSCGTQYSGRPREPGDINRGKPIEPHEWEPRFNSTTGVQDKRQCARCYRSERVEVSA